MPGAGGMMRSAPFQGLAGGIGGQNMGAAALNLANRMGDRPKGMASGGDTQKTRDSPKGVSKEAMAEISKLMQPELSDPFADLQGYGQQHLQGPGHPVPTPRPAPYSIRQEPGAGDIMRPLERGLPLIYRALQIAAQRHGAGGMPPELAGDTRAVLGQDIGFQQGATDMAPGMVSHDLSSLPVIPWGEAGRMGGHPHQSGNAAVRHGRQAAEPKAEKTASTQKRGGVAKKALRMAKRKRKPAKRKGGRV